MFKRFAFGTALLAALAIATPASAAKQTVNYVGSGFTISDLSTMTSTINVTSKAAAGDALFTLQDLKHTWVGDLVGTITHNGVTIDLFNREQMSPSNPFGSNQLFDGDYTFSTSANLPVIAGTTANRTIPGGAYSYEFPVFDTGGQPVSPFFGQSAFGLWTLTITDNAVLDSGSLRAWTLSVVEGAPEPSTWAMMLLGFGFVGTALRRRRTSALPA